MKRGMRSEMSFAAQQRSGSKFDPAEIKSGVIATAAARKQKTDQIVATAAWLSTSGICGYDDLRPRSLRARMFGPVTDQYCGMRFGYMI